MSNRPSAHLWFGTKAETEHPWTTRYEYGDDDEEVIVEPKEDAYDAGERLSKVGVVLVDLSNDDDGEIKVALAAEYHQTDWEGDLDLSDLQRPSVEVIAVLLDVAAGEGWPNVSADDFKWRLGASYG